MRRRFGLASVRAVVLAAAAVGTGCGDGDSVALSEAAQRGRSVYLNLCVACHNADPARDGAIGPNLVGASRELIEWRVVKGAYPPNYTPKRTTGAMPAFPHLAADVDALYSFVRESTADAKAPK